MARLNNLPRPPVRPASAQSQQQRRLAPVPRPRSRSTTTASVISVPDVCSPPSSASDRLELEPRMSLDIASPGEFNRMRDGLDIRDLGQCNLNELLKRGAQIILDRAQMNQAVQGKCATDIEIIWKIVERYEEQHPSCSKRVCDWRSAIDKQLGEGGIQRFLLLAYDTKKRVLQYETRIVTAWQKRPREILGADYQAEQPYFSKAALQSLSQVAESIPYEEGRQLLTTAIDNRCRLRTRAQGQGKEHYITHKDIDTVLQNIKKRKASSVSTLPPFGHRKRQRRQGDDLASSVEDDRGSSPVAQSDGPVQQEDETFEQRDRVIQQSNPKRELGDKAEPGKGDGKEHDVNENEKENEDEDQNRDEEEEEDEDEVNSIELGRAYKGPDLPPISETEFETSLEDTPRRNPREESMDLISPSFDGVDDVFQMNGAKSEVPFNFHSPHSLVSQLQSASTLPPDGQTSGAHNGGDSSDDRLQQRPWTELQTSTHSCFLSLSTELKQPSSDIHPRQPSPYSSPTSQSPPTSDMLSSDVSGARSTLLAGQRLSATAIEIVLSLLRYSVDEVHVFDPQHYDIENHLATDIRPMRKPLSAKVQKILLPLHHRRLEHWTLAIFDLATSSIHHHDSLCNGQGRNTSNIALLHFAKQRLTGLDIEWVVTPVQTSQQNNDYDCGIYTLVAALHAAVGKTVPTETYDCSFWRECFVAFMDSIIHGKAELSGTSAAGDNAEAHLGTLPQLPPSSPKPDPLSNDTNASTNTNHIEHTDDPMDGVVLDFSTAKAGMTVFESATRAHEAAQRTHSHLHEALTVLTPLMHRCNQALDHAIDMEAKIRADLGVLDGIISQYTTKLAVVKEDGIAEILQQSHRQTRQRLEQDARRLRESRPIAVGSTAAQHFALARCSSAEKASAQACSHLVAVRRRLRTLAEEMKSDVQRIALLTGDL